MGRPHCAASRGLWLPSTSMHQARIILAVHVFEASVAQAPGLRQTTAHPEPERVVTETCAGLAVSTAQQNALKTSPIGTSYVLRACPRTLTVEAVPWRTV